MSACSSGRMAWVVGLAAVTMLVALPAPAQWYQLGADIDGDSTDDKCGRAVSLSAGGDRVAVGIPGANANAGIVRVYERSAGVGDWVQIGADIDWALADDGIGNSVAISADGTRVAIGAPYNDDNGTNSGQVRVFEWVDTLGDWAQAGAALVGEAAHDSFGASVALSSNGFRLAVGAPGNDGGGSGAGHVRVFRWIIPNWVQVGYDLDGEAPGDDSGFSVSLSADGSRVAIGAPLNSDSEGQVRVYEWFSLTSTWLHVGPDIDGEDLGDRFGHSVSLSADGSRVAVGAPENDDAGTNAGHARVFHYVSPNWVKLGADIDGEDQFDHAGFSVSLSADGQRVAVGAPDNRLDDRGHVRIFEWFLLTSAWLLVGSDFEGEDTNDRSGFSVALSPDGDYLAIGAPLNDANGPNSGHVRVFSSLIFSDGFELGGTSRWSQVVP